MTLQMISFLFGFQNVFILYSRAADYNNGLKEFEKWRKENNFTYMEIFDKMAPACEDIFTEENCQSEYFEIKPIDTFEYGRCYSFKYKPPEGEHRTNIVGEKCEIFAVYLTYSNNTKSVVLLNHQKTGIVQQNFRS